MNPQLTTEFFHGRVDRVAKDLLGKLLVNEENGCGGYIVETEAYLGRGDPASHLVNAGDKRRETFEKGAGTVYVFKIYHHSNLNFLSENNGITEGILIRALEPVKGLEEMKKRRGVDEEGELASGPGKLTEALGIDKSYNGVAINQSPISIYRTGRDPEIEASRRIGISEAEDWPLRFTVKGSPHISQPLDRGIDDSFEIESKIISGEGANST